MFFFLEQEFVPVCAFWERGGEKKNQSPSQIMPLRGSRKPLAFKSSNKNVDDRKKRGRKKKQVSTPNTAHGSNQAFFKKILKPKGGECFFPRKTDRKSNRRRKENRTTPTQR